MSKLREKVDLEKSRAKQDSDGEEKELEVTIRAKNNAWVISRITRGKELYMALEKANENLLYASDMVEKFSNRPFFSQSIAKKDITKARKIPKRALPIICFKEVSPPLSDASNTSIIDSGLAPLTNVSIEGIQGHQNLELCYPMQRTIWSLFRELVMEFYGKSDPRYTCNSFISYLFHFEMVSILIFLAGFYAKVSFVDAYVGGGWTEALITFYGGRDASWTMDTNGGHTRILHGCLLLHFHRLKVKNPRSNVDAHSGVLLWLDGSKVWTADPH
ncbi:vacuolar fusion protein CCZ1-like protein isoform X2 [Cucumis melo var. makuwa]|uniref:Vacuolar fusion protein CCZ1-like protein isoform X2 n=1 Tax=Cucumis melo var. makuwa TaxID=1194695 RepID=A0A5D3DJM4_CUCMM|nr:vacuolar fusion protein CCZ1-like protein isoform X2 [Cucumis melo var. makuwa]